MSEINAEVLRVFGFWGSILVIKLMMMAMMTARQRFKKKIFLNPEDAATVKGSKVVYDDQDVERVRRAHLNDLENILPWFIATYIWLGTGPSPLLAKNLIRAFVLSRIAHTILYVLQQQPGRALAFFAGYGITLYEVFATLIHYY